MRRNVFLKSAVRKPFKSLIVFLLIGVISFGFMMKLVEYMVVIDETAKLEEYYKPVGRLRPDDANIWYIDDGAALLEADAAVDYLDINRAFTCSVDGVPSGVISGLDEEKKNISYFYGTVLSSSFAEDLTYGYTAPYFQTTFKYLIEIQVTLDEAIVGYEENLPVGEEITLKYFTNTKPEKMPETGRQYLWRALTRRAYIGNNGGEFVILFQVRDMGDGEYFYPVVDGKAQIANPAVKEDMEVRSETIYDSVIRTAKDMTRMPVFHEDFYIDKGRILTREDSLNQNKVCLVHEEFAKMRGLDVGDKLKVTIHEKENLIYTYTDKIKEIDWNDETAYAQFSDITANDSMLLKRRWEGGTVEETLEIVGMYRQPGFGYVSEYELAQIYVPDSIVPKQWKQSVGKTDLTFVLKSARDMEAFMAGTGQKLLEAGYAPEFEKNGWEDFWQAAQPLRQSALAGVVLFGVILLAVMIFGNVFFIYIHRRNRTIIRMLGVSEVRADGQLLAAAFCNAVFAVPAGGIGAWNYGLKKAEEIVAVLTDIPSSGIAGSGPYVENTGVSLPLYSFFIICGAVVLLWTLMSAVGIYIISRRPLMEAMRERAGKLKKNSKSSKVYGEADGARQPGIGNMESGQNKEAVQSDALISGTAVGHTGAGYAGGGQAVRYMFRHLLRTSGRGLMVIIVLAAFIFGLSWIQCKMKLNDEKIGELYDTVEMTGNIVPKKLGVSVFDKEGNIPFWSVADLEATNRFSEFRVQTKERVTMAAIDENNQEIGSYAGGGVNMFVFNSENAYEPLRAGTTQIDFADGYDMSIFETRKNEPGAETAVVREDVLEMLGISVGDRIKVSVIREATFISQSESRSMIYTVAGTFTEEAGTETGYMIFMPVGGYEKLVGTSGVYYTAAEFSVSPSQNRNVDELRAEMAEVLDNYSSQDYLEVDYNLNESELTNAVEPLAKNNMLMRVLYPIVLTVAALVTALICVILTVQSYRETAIMRVLGTTKLRISVILSMERLIVCTFGLCGGLAVSVLTLEGISENILIMICGCAAICLLAGAAASIISAAISVRKRPLEFLQVKE